MKRALCILAISTALTTTQASAQILDLTGRYQCVALCRANGMFAFITQYGTEMNIVNEAGEPSRAWVDYPGHIWVQRENQGAIYSPDGLSIQFDAGTLWQRAPELSPPPPRRR